MFYVVIKDHKDNSKEYKLKPIKNKTANMIEDITKQSINSENFGGIRNHNENSES